MEQFRQQEERMKAYHEAKRNGGNGGKPSNVAREDANQDSIKGEKP